MSLLDKASLVVTPNAYKESKLYSVIPNTTLGDMDVVRATTATRINSAGLVEVVPRNLIENSQVFNVAYWTKDLTTVIDNNTTAPNGTTTAAKLTEAAGTGSHHIHNASGSFTPIIGASYSMSCFVKLPSTAAGRFVQLPFFIAGFGSNAYVNFDLLNGVVGTIGSSITSSSITLIGDGWYRISASALATATGSSGFQLSFITAASSARTQSYTVTAGSEKSIFLYGLQIEAGSATEYFPTTTRLNIPRIDYTNGSCPSLLVEPQRTNLFTYSDQFDNIAWSKFQATVTANNTTSPEGVSSADKLESSTNGTAVLFRTASTGATASTISVYAKAGTNDVLDIGFTNVTDFTVKANLTTGTITSATSGITGTITNVGNGWYRVTATRTMTASGTAFVNSATSISGRFIYIWGAQLEVGAYATSYIPTIASAVTRNMDIISKTGISSLIGQTEGTIFIDFYYKTPSSSINGQLAIADSSGNNRVIIWNIFSLNSLGIQLKANSTNVIDNTSLGVFVNNQRYKIAIGYKSGSTAVYVNGSLSFQNTSSFTFSSAMTDLSIGTYITEGHQLNNSTQIYKTRLTNAELAQLTTL